MSTDRERIEALRAEDRISEADAREFTRALDHLAHRNESQAAKPSGRAPSAAARMRLAFLRGELTAAELRRTTKRTAVRMAILFGVLMFLVWSPLMAITMPGPLDGRALAISFAGGVLHLILSGPLFGWLMYVRYLRPATERMTALVAEAGPILESPERSPAGRCPCCGAENAKVWGPSHPAMLHWIWNPGLAVNELVFGQRVPQSISFCRECGSQFTDCASCKLAVDRVHWSARDAFGAWSGLTCPHCSAELPCLRNAWAGLFLRPLRWVGLAPRT